MGKCESIHQVKLTVIHRGVVESIRMNATVGNLGEIICGSK